MFDLIGSICIIGAVFCMLWQRKKENCRRSETLTDLVLALKNMAEGVRLGRICLPDLLEKVAAGYGKDTMHFFHQISVALREGRDVSEIWRSASQELPIQKVEQAAVASISESLRSDEEGICKGIELAIHALARYKNNWDMHRTEEERRLSAMYVSSALLLVILLI